MLAAAFYAPSKVSFPSAPNKYARTFRARPYAVPSYQFFPIDETNQSNLHTGAALSNAWWEPSILFFT